MQGEQYSKAAEALRAGDLEAARLDRKERLLLEFVATVTQHAYRVTDRQVQVLREAGWSDEQIAEAVHEAALFSLFVRLADAFDIHPPAEYDADGAPPAVAAERSE